jgi:hypothetical protein
VGVTLSTINTPIALCLTIINSSILSIFIIFLSHINLHSKHFRKSAKCFLKFELVWIVSAIHIQMWTSWALTTAANTLTVIWGQLAVYVAFVTFSCQLV